MVSPTLDGLVITCEHAGNRIPVEYEELFRGAARVLASHRGWDPGALPIAQALGRRFETRLWATKWSRLLVEANRSPSNPRIWSSYTAPLARAERERILNRYFWPHRRQVERRVRQVAAGGKLALHIAVHTFTPSLHGVERNADIGLLYDPGRPSERSAAQAWKKALANLEPGLRVRLNYPYRGIADGLPTWLRRRLPDRHYAGFELEINQGILSGPHRTQVRDVIVKSVEHLLLTPVP